MFSFLNKKKNKNRLSHVRLRENEIPQKQNWSEYFT